MAAESHTTEPGSGNSPDDAGADPKEKFRAALDRKAGRHHANNGAAHNDSKVLGEHSRAGGKRTFRRKSGG